jgi:hypothetical protein
MTGQDRDDAISFIAGEDLSAGDRVEVDPETGKVVRCPPDTRCLVTLARDYQAGEVVEFPAETE